MATERLPMPKATSSTEQTQEESTSVIFRSITPADRATLDDIKTIQDIRTDSKAVVFILRDYKLERDRCSLAQRQAHDLRQLLHRAAAAIRAHHTALDELTDVQNEIRATAAAS